MIKNSVFQCEHEKLKSSYVQLFYMPKNII
jgi:hypothetical protein